MKLTYSKTRKQFIISQYNHATKRVEVIDSSPDFDEIAIKHGFVSEDESDDEPDVEPTED